MVSYFVLPGASLVDSENYPAGTLTEGGNVYSYPRRHGKSSHKKTLFTHLLGIADLPWAAANKNETEYRHSILKGNQYLPAI